MDEEEVNEWDGILEFYEWAAHLNMPFIGPFWQNPIMKNCLPSNWLCDHQHANMPSHTSGALSLGANVLKEHTPRIIPRAAVEQPANGGARSFAVGVGGGT